MGGGGRGVEGLQYKNDVGLIVPIRFLVPGLLECL